MTDDADARAFGVAWNQLRSAPAAEPRLGSFTRTRIERAMALVIGVGCAVLGAQAFIAALDPHSEQPAWRPGLQLLVFLPLAAMLLACFVGRGRRQAAPLFIGCYVLALLLWPTAAHGATTTPLMEPWPFFLVNVCTVASVLAFPLIGQIAVTAAVPLLWALVRLAQAGFARPFLGPAILDGSFALILGGVMVALGWVFRAVATGVDAARERAVASYAAAAAAAAAGQERAAVGALMHDSVLAALLAVARADSNRERILATGMAREALTRLADAEKDVPVGPERAVPASAVAERIEASAREIGVRVRVDRPASVHAVMVPGVVARAVALAAAQAVANAAQHAGGVGLRVGLHADDTAGTHVAVDVVDHGPGFDPDGVPADRLGIRASIVARMAAVGGQAQVRSGPHGTTVVVEWAEAEPA